MIQLLTSVLAQASSGSSSSDGQTVEIDPSATDAIKIITPDAGEQTIQAEGAVSKALDKFVPNSGNESVDGAVHTLTDAIGGMVDSFLAMLPQIVIAIVVLVAAGIVVRLVDKLALKVFRRARVKESLRDLFRIFIRTGVWFAGIMVALAIIFPGFGVAQLVASAGLVSIALGFAFQDIFENFFAGILILWRFPFENGDFIQVDDIKGRVEDVEIRMTLIRQTDGDLVLVPNSTIFKSNVTIYTNRPTRRIELAVGIAYGEDVAEGRRIILDAVKACETVESSPPPEVLATSFGASSIDFDVLWYTGNKPIQERRSRDEVIEAIKKALDDAGIEIPYPYRTLTFTKNEPDIINAVAGRLGKGPATDDQGSGD